MFSKSTEEISHGNERLQPFLFQDDIIRGANSIEALKHGNSLIDHVMEEKLLNFILDKSKFMVIGTNEVTKEIRNKLDDAQEIKLSGSKMDETGIEKYLGDFFTRMGIINQFSQL